MIFFCSRLFFELWKAMIYFVNLYTSSIILRFSIFFSKLFSKLWKSMIYFLNLYISSITLLVDRQHHGQIIHPTENLISMDLFKILCAVTWTLFFLTSNVMEAVRGQNTISLHTLWHQYSLHPSVPLLLTKDSSRHEIS